MNIYEDVASMKAARNLARRSGRTIGFVPTMGYLHEGHLELVREAKKRADWVVVSIFVNPLQFGPTEDLDRYPRDFERDCELLVREGVDALFFPVVGEFYPEGFQTSVDLGPLTEPLCGAARPGHFKGVATVVTKLFNVVAPDVAVFGEKDYQQLQVIKRMVVDLDMDVDIVGLPTVREPDGLAMSSRNSYLSEAERTAALAIPRALSDAAADVTSGETDAGAIEAKAAAMLEGAGMEVIYVEVRDPFSLEKVSAVEEEIILAVSAKIGNTKLIDNMLIRP